MIPDIPMPTDISGLPGEDMLRRGLADAASGRRTADACLVWVALPRLARHGLLAPAQDTPREPERLLYGLLCEEGGDAYGRYNALLRTLTSFERALDHRRARASKRGLE